MSAASRAVTSTALVGPGTCPAFPTFVPPLLVQPKTRKVRQRATTKKNGCFMRVSFQEMRQLL
jgi:hypothetical protein